MKKGRFCNAVAMDVAACRCAKSSLCASGMSMGEVMAIGLYGVNQGSRKALILM